MTDRNLPLVTVVGATSKQGRSVASTLLAGGRHRVRALTRDVGGARARALAAQGAEVLAVPLELGHREALVRAFRGAQAAFIMTPPIAPPDTHEVALGKELADAAVAAEVEHVVFSSLENVDAITGGKKFAPHFTDKARVEEYIRGLPVTSTFVYPAFFYTNLVELYPPQREGNTLVFPIYLPADVRAPFVDPRTATGPAVGEILEHPARYAGAGLPIVGDIVSPREMVETFRAVTGRDAVLRSAYTRAELLHYFPHFGSNELLVRELLGMVEYAAEYGYFQPHRDLAWSRRVDPQSLTWEDFLRRTGWQGEPGGPQLADDAATRMSDPRRAPAT